MKKILLLIVLLVLAAGCTGNRQVQVDDSNGLRISTFITSPSVVESISGDTVLFDMEVENVGGTTAKNVQIDLYGVQGQWRDANGNLLTSTQTKTLGTMKPPIASRNIPGDFKMAQWEFKTPAIPQGITPDLKIEGRVSYDYNTSGHLIVPVVSEDEFRRSQIESQPIEEPVIINSQGPIKLTLSANNRFIILDTTSSGSTYTHPFRIELQNVGAGFPITPEVGGGIIGAGGRLTGTIQLLGPGVEFDDCLGVSGGNEINLDDASIMVRLRDSGTVPIVCNIKFDKTVWGNRPTDSVQFIFNLFYRYYVREEVSVRVVGR